MLKSIKRAKLFRLLNFSISLSVISATSSWFIFFTYLTHWNDKSNISYFRYKNPEKNFFWGVREKIIGI